MASKRQKLARKRFREEHPELFPKPEQSKDSDSKKKEKNKKRNKKLEIRRKGKKGGTRKHPLRVVGMRPGECCFICKSKDHIAKLCPEKSAWEKNKICLLCRQRGHVLKNCPQKGETVNKKFCYNCGETGHSLSKCPSPLQDGGTKFASCFICNEHGHLIKDCPKNTHGIYPKGGSCKICGGITHLVKDCLNKNSRDSFATTGTSSIPDESRRGKRTVFHGGDDLEDDFTAEDMKAGKVDAAMFHSTPELAASCGEVEKNTHAKPNKKQGPKVVYFLG